MFRIYLRKNSDLCHLHYKRIGFYNRDEKCLLHCTNWVFKKSSMRFVFKGLTQQFCSRFSCPFSSGSPRQKLVTGQRYFFTQSFQFSYSASLYWLDQILPVPASKSSFQPLFHLLLTSRPWVLPSDATSTWHYYASVTFGIMKPLPRIRNPFNFLPVFPWLRGWYITRSMSTGCFSCRWQLIKYSNYHTKQKIC